MNDTQCADMDDRLYTEAEQLIADYERDPRSLPHMIADHLAAAEERGRRRGVEEATDEAGKLRVILLHARRWMRTDSPSWVKSEVDAVLPHNLTELASRDSAPDPDPTCPEDFEPPWPRDSGKEDQR